MTSAARHARLRAMLLFAAVLFLILSTSYIRGSGDFIEFYIAARRFMLRLDLEF